MAKSSTPLWLATALVSAPTGIPAPTFDQLVERQRARVETAIRPGCDRAAGEDEIVVCGAREDDRTYRVAPSAEPGRRPGERAGGEQRAALAVDASRCNTVGRSPQCNGGLDVIGIGFTIARAIVQALANRD